MDYLPFLVPFLQAKEGGQVQLQVALQMQRVVVEVETFAAVEGQWRLEQM